VTLEGGAEAANLATVDATAVSAGNDVLVDATAYQTDGLTFLGGADSLDGGNGDDWLDGGNGVDSMLGGNGDDTILSGLEAETLDGGAGEDSLVAGEGNDFIDGGADNDFLQGDDGDDTLTGGIGDDSMLGGIDADVFNYTALALDNTGDVRSNDADTISGVEDGELLDITDDLAALLTSDESPTGTAGLDDGEILGTTIDGSNNIAFDDTSDLLMIDTNANGVFDAGADFTIQLVGVTSVTYNAAGSTFTLDL
jgi:Ca2+-binding RTX toxin-like protein